MPIRIIMVITVIRIIVPRIRISGERIPSPVIIRIVIIETKLVIGIPVIIIGIISTLLILNYRTINHCTGIVVTIFLAIGRMTPIPSLIVPVYRPFSITAGEDEGKEPENENCFAGEKGCLHTHTLAFW
jgi:hypothetical protein